MIEKVPSTYQPDTLARRDMPVVVAKRRWHQPSLAMSSLKKPSGRCGCCRANLGLIGDTALAVIESDKLPNIHLVTEFPLLLFIYLSMI